MKRINNFIKAFDSLADVSSFIGLRPKVWGSALLLQSGALVYELREVKATSATG